MRLQTKKEYFVQKLNLIYSFCIVCSKVELVVFILHFSVLFVVFCFVHTQLSERPAFLASSALCFFFYFAWEPVSRRAASSLRLSSRPSCQLSLTLRYRYCLALETRSRVSHSCRDCIMYRCLASCQLPVTSCPLDAASCLFCSCPLSVFLVLLLLLLSLLVRSWLVLDKALGCASR